MYGIRVDERNLAAAKPPSYSTKESAAKWVRRWYLAGRDSLNAAEGVRPLGSIGSGGSPIS